jgi:GNAT superfamily N-acetyltransferase
MVTKVAQLFGMPAGGAAMSDIAVHVRASISSDVTAMVDFVEERRLQYEAHQPVFWRKADDSTQKSKLFFSALIANEAVTTLTAVEGSEVVGFLIALDTPAPPVVNPGGPTVTVDDFCVSNPSRWADVGTALMDQLRQIGRRQQWRQMVVICGNADTTKKRFLQSVDLSIASTWWTATF